MFYPHIKNGILVSVIRIFLLQKDTAARVNSMEGFSTLGYGNLSTETRSILEIEEDPRILATSYMMYKIGEW